MKLIFERSRPGRGNDLLPSLDVPAAPLPEKYRRKTVPRLPELGESDLSRHYQALARRAFGVCDGFYPLGSCTMKYNPKLGEEAAALPGFTGLHPLQPAHTVQGAQAVLARAEHLLCEITGMDAVTLQPAAGAHGEFLGLLLIKAYHHSQGDTGRTVILVPDSAHGTNPASAAMAGFTVKNIPSTPEGLVDLEALREVPCWAGLDLASTRDLTSLRLVWKVGDQLLTWGRRWVPESAVATRTERGTVPYAGWVAAGYIEETPGDVTDYAVVEAAVLEARERFNLQSVAFDRWNATEMVSRLVEAEVPMVEFVQGPKSYHPAMQELERKYIAGKLAHAGDPVLTWCAANLVPRRDVNLNMAPDKRRSADKIDDMTALLMAVGVSLAPEADAGLADFLSNPVIG